MSDRVLVTGFPRMIARRVAERVLDERPEARVDLLADGDALDRARSWAAERGGRARVIEGSCASIDLGLAGAEWRALKNEVTHIQHLAHETDESTPADRARAAHVTAAREVLELAQGAPRLRRLVFLSTASVHGLRTGTVFEDELDRGQRFHGELERSRFLAERIVRRAMDTVPVTVLRPTHVVGDSRTGEIDRFEGPYLMALLVLSAPPGLTLPLPSRGDAPLHLVPIDHVAAAATAVMDAPAARSATLHLTDPSPLAARRVFELLSAAAGRKGPRGFIPANVTRAILRTPGLERVLRSPRAFFEHLIADVTYDARCASSVLDPLGVRCPSLETYVDRLMQHLRDRLEARRTRAQAERVADIDDPLA
jgi:thioester reductase-like protein